MIRTRVTSSNLVSVGYDSTSMLLEIEFSANSIYQYSGVPDHIHRGLMNSSSKGSYFHNNIKDHYATRKIS